MPALIQYVLLMLVILAAIMAIPPWIASRSPKGRNVIAFLVACGSSYATSFAIDIFLLVILGQIPSSNAIAPIFTWSSIGFAAAVSAFSCARSPVALALPFFFNSVIAIAMVFSHLHNLFVGLALIVVGVALFIAKRRVALAFRQ